ncbi:hypothetical protein D3C86_1125460 [compost metagenome]
MEVGVALINILSSLLFPDAFVAPETVNLIYKLFALSTLFIADKSNVLVTNAEVFTAVLSPKFVNDVPSILQAHWCVVNPVEVPLVLKLNIGFSNPVIETFSMILLEFALLLAIEYALPAIGVVLGSLTVDPAKVVNSGFVLGVSQLEEPLVPSAYIVAVV